MMHFKLRHGFRILDILVTTKPNQKCQKHPDSYVTSQFYICTDKCILKCKKYIKYIKIELIFLTLSSIICKTFYCIS